MKLPLLFIDLHFEGIPAVRVTSLTKMEKLDMIFHGAGSGRILVTAELKMVPQPDG